MFHKAHDITPLLSKPLWFLTVSGTKLYSVTQPSKSSKKIHFPVVFTVLSVKPLATL